MTNTRKWLMILILPFIFVSSSALAAFDDNLSHVCEKSSGSIIKVYQDSGLQLAVAPSNRRQIQTTMAISARRFLMLTVLIYINLVHAQQTRLQLMTFQLVHISLTLRHRWFIPFKELAYQQP